MLSVGLIQLQLLSYSMNIYSNTCGEWATLKTMEKIKSRGDFTKMLKQLLLSFSCDLGSRNMIWKLESEIQKLSSTPKTEKKREKNVLPLL